METKRATQHSITSQSDEKDNKYPALRTISGLYILIAWLSGFAAIGLSIYLLLIELYLNFIITLLSGGLIVLAIVGISEGIKVFLDIEYNTRCAHQSVDNNIPKPLDIKKELSDEERDKIIAEGTYSQITVKHKVSGRVERVSPTWWERMKKTYGEDSYEIIDIN